MLVNHNKSEIAFSIGADGFALHHNILTKSECDTLIDALAEDHQVAGSSIRRRAAVVYATRNLLQLPAMRQLARSAQLISLVEPYLGTNPLPVRGILFDKTAGANWKMAWHQDLSIAVKERLNVPGFGPWSNKAGVVHVQPPAAVLEQMLTVRLHLDDCDVANGPLMVPASL